jgi:endonuclease III
MREKGHSHAARGKIIESLMERFKGRFSVILGINLFSGNSGEIFKWFIASLLFGTRISEAIVIRTYREFESEGILSPSKILNTGWDGLVEILDRGGYVRYDFKTATKFLDVNKALMERYKGDLNNLHSMASDTEDLEKKLKALGKGIGDMTVNIFLREMRGIWQKAEPLPSELVILAARHLGIIPRDGKNREEILKCLKKKWDKEGMEMEDFADFEVALLRLGKDFCRKMACERCLLKEGCKYRQFG